MAVSSLIITKLNEYITSITKCENSDLDYLISDIRCFIEEESVFNDIYNQKVKEYKDLTIQEDYSNRCKKLFNFIYENFSSEHAFLSPFGFNKKTEIVEPLYTALYFPFLDELIERLDEQCKNLISDYDLLHRNMQIISYYFANFNLDNVPHLFSDFLFIKDIDIKYSFFFFDFILQHEEIYNCHEQIRIATIDILKYFRTVEKEKINNLSKKKFDILEKIKKSKFKNDLIAILRNVITTPEITIPQLAENIYTSEDTVKNRLRTLRDIFAGEKGELEFIKSKIEEYKFNIHEINI